MSAIHRSIAQKSLEVLLRDLFNRANEPPHPGSLPLTIAGHPCGVALAKAARALADLQGVEVSEHAIAIGRMLAPGPALDSLLENVAKTLRSAGCAPGWRNELLDIWSTPDTQCLRLGAIERGVMRPLGLATRAVHLNARSEQGHLWVARRSLTKKTDPGMWDTLVGGLVGSQEADELALVRETDEEAGLDAHQIANRTPLRAIHWMRRRIPEGYQYEQVLTCECVLAPDVTPSNRDGEVMEIRCLAPAVILEMIREGAFTTEASIVIVEDLLNRSA